MNYLQLPPPGGGVGGVAQELGVSKTFAYKLVRQMNEELEEKGFITIAGRVSRKYYEENSSSGAESWNSSLFSLNHVSASPFR